MINFAIKQVKTNSMDSKQAPNFSEIIEAQKILKPIVKQTTIEHSRIFSNLSGAEVFLKLENLQSTGSFKVRGAVNKLYHLTPEELSHGVTCASAGNHAQGVAFAASKMDVHSKIFMPIFTPPLKVIATKAYGADVELIGDNFDEAYVAAKKYAAESNATFIEPFDDRQIIAGQGTIALEIFDQLKDIDEIYVPIGGGGLISGIAIVAKQINPSIKIIGVESEGTASMINSIKKKQIITLPQVSSIADGIAVKRPGELTYKIISELVDDFVVVSDEEIAHITYLLLQRGKLLAEPSGVASLAAIAGRKRDCINKRVLAVISGGNVKMSLLEQILEKGMLNEKLRVRINVLTPDVSGELNEITNILDKFRANIHDIWHDRFSNIVPVGHVRITITFHLQEECQIEMIKNELEKRNKVFEVLD